MAVITIRNLDEDTKRRLRVRAAENGRSMEEEAREALRKSVEPSTPLQTLWQAARSAVEATGGFELKIPPRTPPRKFPDFG